MKYQLYNEIYVGHQEMMFTYLYLFYVFSNAGSFLILKVLQFYLKLSYPIEILFLFPAGFELRILLLAFDADTLTD